ncbi:MAG: PEPxxWA-CTERM sorting domain-containing protein [Sphingopyxis sp.]|nr:PEPxxWA-CTERM sorting domain-containing protein [Sphingopyxis sp.]
MRMKHALALVTAAAVMAPASASAAIVIVDAKANSSSGGVAKSSGFSFLTGQGFRVRSSTNDLWSAGALPRFSDGSGLTGNRNATVSDDSGVTPGTQIGASFGTHTQNGFTAPFGALVGRWADGTYQLLGANFTGAATGSGALDLYYWDSNSGDNSGQIAFNITAGIPEPATWAMLILGFGLVGGTMRRANARVATRVRFA